MTYFKLSFYIDVCILFEESSFSIKESYLFSNEVFLRWCVVIDNHISVKECLSGEELFPVLSYEPFCKGEAITVSVYKSLSKRKVDPGSI